MISRRGFVGAGTALLAARAFAAEWKAPERNEVKGGFDEEAAEHKGISGRVAGKADILLVPDLISGNILHKSLHFFAGGMLAGVVCGTDYPVILTSRTDEPDTKYRSILLAVLLSLRAKAGTSKPDAPKDAAPRAEER